MKLIEVSYLLKSLVKVGYYIVDVLGADAQAYGRLEDSLLL